jgi:hypothetical protein
MKRRQASTAVLVLFATLLAMLVLTPPASAQQVVSVDHSDSVVPDGDFEVTVETDGTTTSAVEVSGDGFDTGLSVVDADGDSASQVSDSRVEFISFSGDGGTYTLDVNVSGGADGDTGTISVYAGGDADENSNEDSATSTFTVVEDTAQVSSLDSPGTVQPDGDFDVTFTTSNAATSAIEVDPSGFDVNLSVVDDDGDNAFDVSEDRIEFLDVSGEGGTYVVNVNVTDASRGETGEVVAYAGGNATEIDNDDTVIESFAVEGSDTGGGVTPPDNGIVISNKNSVTNGGSLTVTVAMSAGTTAAVELEAKSFDADLSVADSDGDSPNIVSDERIEFIDISGTESTYVLDVNVTNASPGDSGKIKAYLGGNANETDNEYSSVSEFKISDLYTSPVDGVSDELWTEVTGDGNLELGDLGTAIQEYQANGEINGVTIELGDLGSLIQHYQS